MAGAFVFCVGAAGEALIKPLHISHVTALSRVGISALVTGAGSCPIPGVLVRRSEMRDQYHDFFPFCQHKDHDHH